jgi:Peptidase_C39 like family
LAERAIPTFAQPPKVLMITFTAALLLAPIAAAVIIPNVPYHRQITDYACGDASTEMVLHYWASPDVDQRAIIDVMRTMPEGGLCWVLVSTCPHHFDFLLTGTLSYDIVRAGHFSAMSKSVVAGQYPDQTPVQGWSPYRKLGMAAYARRGGECWLDDLKTLIDGGIPVIVLQYYGPEPDRLVRGNPLCRCSFLA